MTCPDCGHANLDGLDVCAHCGQDLASIGLDAPTAGLKRCIMETPLHELDPAPALIVAPADPVSAVIRLMQKGRQGSALVVDRGRLAGIFTERDALNRLAGKGLDLDAVRVSEVMTRDPRVLREDDTLAFVMHCMAVEDCRHVPIVTEGRPPRFVSVRGVLRYLHENAG